MNGVTISLNGADLTALPSGALWWEHERILTVSDLHLGKSDRIARRSAALLPPYDIRDTLQRLDSEVSRLAPAVVICLGDSFDDLAAVNALDDSALGWLARLQAGRRWIWIEGNHDPGPVGLGGEHLSEFRHGPLDFRHIANEAASAEVSGHYHPKATLNGRGKSVTRAAFLADSRRVIMPAFGTYTGGLRSTAEILDNLMGADALAILTGRSAHAIPMPRQAAKRAATFSR